MRRLITSVLAAGLMAGSSVPALAQADDPMAEVERVEVLEAGVAVTFPAAWSADIEMREREDWGLYDEGFAEEPVAFWNVVYASDGGRPWCDLVWYPVHPLTMEEHAERYQALMTPTSADVERPIEVLPVSLPAGEAYRFLIYNEPTDDYTTVYLLGAGEARYLLQCASDERSADDWLVMAESLEVLEVTSESVEEE